MTNAIGQIGAWLRRRAENIAVLLLAIMFLAFLVEIALRYVFSLPLGWAFELTVTTWLWLVLWGAAFVVPEQEEIRFDLIYTAVPRGVRRIMAIVFSVALLVVYIGSLPAVIDYVTFMKVKSTSYLNIRFDYLYSIYIIFAVAIIIRYFWVLWCAFRGSIDDEFDPDHEGSSGL